MKLSNIMELKYIIFSTENYCVYTWSSSVNVANALLAGDGDSRVRAVSEYTSDFKKINATDLSVDNTYLLNGMTNSITQISNDKVSDSWKKQKKLLLFRQRCFNYCFTHIRDSYTRITRNVWESFDVVATSELLKCNPDQNYYTPMIEEYATILGVSCAHAYKELKFVIESDNMLKFRIQALAEKWKNIINNTVDLESYNIIKQGIIRDFWLNANI